MIFFHKKRSEKKINWQVDIHLKPYEPNSTEEWTIPQFCSPGWMGIIKATNGQIVIKNSQNKFNIWHGNASTEEVAGRFLQCNTNSLII